jgi:hypothetical protein
MLPPEAPRDGVNSKLSKLGGQKFLIYWESKNSLFVSWRQIISHLDSVTLLRMAFHLLSELIPLIFQHRIFKALLLFELFIVNQSEEGEILVCTARKGKNKRDWDINTHQGTRRSQGPTVRKPKRVPERV